ncbi:MAG: NAD-dependent epimerase/dehydratase family protein [Candidatus Aenigmarchaeota archaeon]|nr:NAD-dependent epimerase/dehydratase family protein [Candidatus Aenigmarchaeota archaeon]
MRVLITGSNGFIGSHVCKALLEKNHEVFGISRGKECKQSKLLTKTGRLHYESCNLNSLTRLQEIIKKNNIESVIHLAAYPTYGSTDPSHNVPCLENNVVGTLNTIHACFLSGVKNFIYASAMGVYGKPLYLPVNEEHPKNPKDFHSLTKLQGEEYCRLYSQYHGINSIILRCAGVYGPGKEKGAVHNFFHNVLNGKLPKISSGGNQTRDLVYVADIVDATLNALKIIKDTRYDTFNIGSGREISINELLKRIIEISESDIDFNYIPDKSNDRFVLDIKKAKNKLDYNPRDLGTALKDFLINIKSGV